MRRTVWIALAGFLLGIVAAGYIFFALPDKKAERPSFLESSAQGLSSPLFAGTAQAKPDLDFVAISEKVGPAVVTLESERLEDQAAASPFDDFYRFFNQRQPREPVKARVSGTGFFISSDGYILTNNHLVEKATRIDITPAGGQKTRAKVIGTDPLSDLALIKIEAKGVPFVELGDSAKLQVGEWVLAIGNPYGMDHTVTAGIVSAKGRQLGLGGNTPTYQDFIQTDAAINRGNSGGPLVNMKGEVIGINSNILAPQGTNLGIGFAIPSNLARKVVLQLKDKGKVIRGYLGILPGDVDEETRESLKLKDRRGALINSVEPGTPAEKAGLKPYDVIVEINGQPVKDTNDLRFKIADLQPGSKVDLKVVRDGAVKSLTATVAELEGQAAQPAAKARKGADLGLEVQELNARVAQRLGIKAREGLIVTDVAQGSPAEEKGLQVYDIIVEVNRAKVTTLAEWDRILERAKPGDVLMLGVMTEAEGRVSSRIVTLRVGE